MKKPSIQPLQLVSSPLQGIPRYTPSESPRITGVIQCRNEWGLIALSIGFALTNHVDEVFVLNDSSTDETYWGLECLKEIWPGRIHVFNQSGGKFFQEAQLNTLVSLARQSNSDWIYVFDADEFLLMRNGRCLKDDLSLMPLDCKAVRYELKNFVSCRTFNDQSLCDFLKINQQGIANKSQQMDDLQNYEEILKGNLNFFHIPFPFKVIFRNEGPMRLSAGCHRISYYKNSSYQETDAFYAAHLSWLSMARLRRKAAQGRKHVVNGFNRKHGWQNQLIYQIANEGRLEELWARHSISEPGQPLGHSPTNVLVNLDFQSAILTTVQTLVQAGFDPDDLRVYGARTIPAMEAPATLFSFQDLIALTNHYHQDLKEPNPRIR